MTTEEFYKLKREVCEKQNPFKVVNLSQIQMIRQAEDYLKSPASLPLSVCGIEVLADKAIGQVLDRMIGISKKQNKYLCSAYGKNNIHTFWNYLAAATSITQESKIVLVADRERRIITNAVVIKEKPITPEVFFNMAELFMDKNNMYPLSIERDDRNHNGLILKMKSNNPKIVEFFEGEEFATNNYYLKWSLDTIELGRYFERLVCKNGMIATSARSINRIHTTSKGALNTLIAFPKEEILLEETLQEFSQQIEQAINTKASIAELKFVRETLSEIGIDNEYIEKIAPYEQLLNQYQKMGYNLNAETEHLAMSDMSVWKVYNNLTEFATHTTVLEKTDNRRSLIQIAASRFLERKRDIKRYVNIF